MFKFITDNWNLCCAGGHVLRNFAGRSFRQIIILILLIIFSSFSSYSIAGIRKKQNISKMVQRSDLIVRGKVISTESQWKEDSLGRHIYTNVTVKILDKIKGNIKDGAFAFEVVGGTVDDIREIVSHIPAFEIDEDAIVFLAEHPRTSQQVTNGKILIYDGRVYWDDSEITVGSFIRSLKDLKQDPNASISLMEKYWVPTERAAIVPMINSISTEIEPDGADTQVTIKGKNFGPSQGVSKVEFFYKSRQQKKTASIVSWSNKKIICTAPVGTASAGNILVIVTTSDGTSSGYVIDAADCYIYSGYKWPGTSPTVSYKINQNTSDCTGEGTAVQRGASTWNNVGANFRFQYNGSHTRTVKSRNNINEILWGTTQNPDALAERSAWVENNVKILECDVVFNDDPDWYTTWSTDPVPPSSEYDVESVALHEFGHWLSLGDLDDSACSDCAMYYQLGNGEVSRTLCGGDCDGICYIYGCPCSIDVTSPSSTSNWATGTSHTIRWTSSGNPGSYVKIQLYKGSSLIETITSSTYDDGSRSWTPSTSLADGSDYRIKISATTDSSCYDYSSYFDLYTPCSITVTSPTGSSNWVTGTSHTIRWTSSGNPSPYVKIELYKGSSKVQTIRSLTSDDLSDSWIPSSSLDDGSDYRIKISSYTDSSCYDYSSYFDLYTPCSITVTSPDGGWYELDANLPIRWDSENTSGDVKIELYKGGSLERVIEESWPDPCSYEWPIPDDVSLTGDDDYQIKVTDVSNSSCYDYSNNFGIATPPEAHDGTVTTSVDTPVTITLQATDEGQPDPPAALTYTIMSLPIFGDLNEPGMGLIIDPCTPLASYGNQVEYIPDIGYEGQDSFTFIADDNGVPPGGGDSNEATVTINVTACIFFDDFPSTTLDTNNWTETSGPPTVDTAGDEPSPPYSLHLEATDSVTSRVIDLYGCWSAQLNYSWKRVGTESGDDLYLDYRDGNEWKTLQVLPGGADTSWELNSVELPADALHEEFRLRFRADCDSTDDEWYIDDVCIQCQSCIEPPLIHAESNTQGTCNTIYWDQVADANEYYAECANDANFTNSDADSGWIADTNYEFCGLALGQTYWYRVMAWAPFSLKTWLQTSQTDFETDTLTDTITTSDGNVVLAGGGSILFQDDFEDGNYDGWVHGTSSCTRQVTDETTAAGTTYSFTQIGSSEHRQGVYYTLPSITPDRIKFYVRTNNSTNASGYVILDGANSSQCSVFFYIYNDLMRASSSSTSCESLTWYKVEFVFQWLTKTFDFYVDDELVADSIPFRIPAASYIDTIHLYNFHSAQAWWDEIEFSTGSGGGYTPIGDIVSTPIDLPADGNWVVVDFNMTIPADTELTVDILPAAGSTPISGYENVYSGADLSEVGEPTIRLRANLSTTDANYTPALYDWSVIYTDPALACESEWSNVESSFQCRDMSGDFEPDCDVDRADLAIFVEQWLLPKLSMDVIPSGGDGFVDFSDWAAFADGWGDTKNIFDLADFKDQWLQRGAYCADIAPLPEGDGMVNFLDFAEFAIHWLEGI